MKSISQAWPNSFENARSYLVSKYAEAYYAAHASRFNSPQDNGILLATAFEVAYDVFAHQPMVLALLRLVRICGEAKISPFIEIPETP